MINKWDIDDTIIYIHILIQSWFYPVLPKGNNKESLFEYYEMIIFIGA